MKQPELIHSIWDNGGETFDRYTVVLNEMNGIFHDMLGLSHNPWSPQGFSQFCQGSVGPHLGSEVNWDNLPEDIQKHVIVRLKNN